MVEDLGCGRVFLPFTRRFNRDTFITNYSLSFHRVTVIANHCISFDRDTLATIGYFSFLYCRLCFTNYKREILGEYINYVK